MQISLIGEAFQMENHDAESDRLKFCLGSCMTLGKRPDFSEFQFSYQFCVVVVKTE